MCPITQEPIIKCIVLRGAKFELDAIVKMLHQGRSRSTHPYDRTHFTTLELVYIHNEALARCPEVLAETGWTQQTSFVADLSTTAPVSTVTDTAPTQVRGPGEEDETRDLCSCMCGSYHVSCTAYETCVVCMLTVLCFLMIGVMMYKSVF